MERIRREVLENQLARIAVLMGKTSGNPWARTGDKNVARVGCLTLDKNSTYGGFVVEEICSESGAVRHPFVSRRLKASEMWAVLYSVEQALEQVKAGQDGEECPRCSNECDGCSTRDSFLSFVSVDGEKEKRCTACCDAAKRDGKEVKPWRS